VSWETEYEPTDFRVESFDQTAKVAQVSVRTMDGGSEVAFHIACDLPQECTPFAPRSPAVSSKGLVSQHAALSTSSAVAETKLMSRRIPFWVMRVKNIPGNDACIEPTPIDPPDNPMIFFSQLLRARHYSASDRLGSSHQCVLDDFPRLFEFLFH
jgi:hypothetical protein